MQRFKNKKFLAVAMSIVLTLSLAITALAAWPSFQGGVSNYGRNNGVIDPAVNGIPPISTPATVGKIGLAVNNPNNSVFSGIDNVTVMNTVSGVTTAYTVYNGGVYNSATGFGGARLAITNLSTQSVNNILLDPSANNVQQLATPYLNSSTNMLYAATTFYTNQLQSTGTAGWTGTGVTPPTFTFLNGTTTTITYSGLTIPSGDYWEPQFATDINISANGLSGDVELQQSGVTVVDFGSQSYYPNYGPWTLFNLSGSLVNSGTYDLVFTVTNNTGSDITATSLQFLTSGWNLWQVDVSVASPTPVLLGTGDGQANTHLEYYSDQHQFIYFGIYEGDRSYYQYLINSGTLTRFNAQDDFYWAGAMAVRLTGNGQAVFGGDSGKIYVQDATNFGAPGGIIILDNSAATPTNPVGKVRSTIVVNGTNNATSTIYFTSTGTINGLLWTMPTANLPTTATTITITTCVDIPNSDTSVSTPVISANGILYVGTSAYNTSTFTSTGTVQAFNSTTLAQLATVYTGDPVQASPIVYSNTTPGVNRADYVYFTTNADHTYDPTPVTNHNGYCYRVGLTILTNPVPSLAWNPVTGGTYALQGFASDNGYVIYGDDSSNLYIFK